MPPKRRAIEMTGKYKMDDPFGKINEKIEECQKCIFHSSWALEVCEGIIKSKSNEVRKHKEIIDRLEQELRAHIYDGEISRNKLQDLVEQEKMFVAIKERGEEFEEKFTKGVKKDLKEMMEKELNEVEMTLQKRRKKDIKEI